MKTRSSLCARERCWTSWIVFVLVLVPLVQGLAAAGSSSSSSSSRSDDRLYDFDGEYGRNYRAFIRKMIPGYDDTLEMIGDVVVATTENARTEVDNGSAASVLVIGPGHGEELVAIARALSSTSLDSDNGADRLTWNIMAYEASESMAQACEHLMKKEGFEDRVSIIAEAYGNEQEESCAAENDQGNHQVVTLLNVLHLMPLEQQKSLLLAAANQVKVGGTLLVAGMNLPDKDDVTAASSLRIVFQRWNRLGIDAQKREEIMGSVGKTIFSIEAEEMNQTLNPRFAPMREIHRGLNNVMWYTERVR